MGQKHLFASWLPSKDRILAEHVDALGYLPREWWEIWTDHTQYFNSSDQLQKVHGSPRRLLGGRVEYAIQGPRKTSGMTEMDKEEKPGLPCAYEVYVGIQTRRSAFSGTGSRVQLGAEWAKPTSELMDDSVATLKLIFTGRNSSCQINHVTNIDYVDPFLLHFYI
jgi:hypothetical protein